MRIAMVSREIHPLGSGGLGQSVGALSDLLTEIAEVTLVTSSESRERYGARRVHDPEELGDVRVAFVDEPEPDEVAAWGGPMPLYTFRVLEKLRDLYADGAPDLIEFPDRLGEAFGTVQAADALDPFLDDTAIAVRLHTSREMCCVLNGHLARDLHTRRLVALERCALAQADHVLWPGGDVLNTYQQFYGPGGVGPATHLRVPHRLGVAATPEGGERRAGALRVLFCGPLERRKGITALVRAVVSMREEVELTVTGADTDTGRLGTSIRTELEALSAGDPRVCFVEPLGRDDLACLMTTHDVVAVPSRWECWPTVALEAMRLDVPVLATPVGGLVEMVQADESGWLTAGTDHLALRATLRRLAAQETPRLAGDASPRRIAERLAAPRPILEGYEALLDKPRPRRRRRSTRQPPVVSVVIPYHQLSEYVGEAVQSVVAQTYPRVEIVLVNDGSFDREDLALADVIDGRPITVVSQRNAGLAAARNIGILRSAGRYVLPLDADNLIEPDFVHQAVAILEERPAAAYVTAWSRYVDAGGDERDGPDLGYEPLGNRVDLSPDDNAAGDAAAVVRRSVFDRGFRYDEDLGSFEDWHLYRRLGAAGHFGVVIPKRLIRYRLREGAIHAKVGVPHRERLLGEMSAKRCEDRVRWTV